MNRFELFLLQLKKDMKAKKITSLQMSIDLGVTKGTVSTVLSGKRGTFDTLNKMIEYIDSK
ncbi:MAG: helix-turn-helix domain-containing protein [Fusobacteriaceae bacterium]